MDVEVSRFIRDTADHDVQVFWRAIEPDKHSSLDEKAPVKNELCNVPISEIKGREYWSWDHMVDKWVRLPVLSPGMIVMLRQADGGYHPTMGWTGDKNDIPDLLYTGIDKPEGYDGDLWSLTDWQTLDNHTDKVVQTLLDILSKCPIGDETKESLIIASRWHDAGKAHPVCQKAMIGEPPEVDPSLVWAKAAKKKITYSRRGFRHELASSLALLENGYPDLSTYLAAAHHGKVRLSIRSLPHEGKPVNDGIRFARGIWDGDSLEETYLGNGVIMPKTILNLSYMEIGENENGASWLARMLALRDSPDLGPFRLAFLEALLRCADWRASGAGDNN